MRKSRWRCFIVDEKFKVLFHQMIGLSTSGGSVQHFKRFFRYSIQSAIDFFEDTTPDEIAGESDDKLRRPNSVRNK